jgi:hypothetical protein
MKMKKRIEKIKSCIEESFKSKVGYVCIIDRRKRHISTSSKYSKINRAMSASRPPEKTHFYIVKILNYK